MGIIVVFISLNHLIKSGAGEPVRTLSLPICSVEHSRSLVVAVCTEPTHLLYRFSPDNPRGAFPLTVPREQGDIANRDLIIKVQRYCPSG